MGSDRSKIVQMDADGYFDRGDNANKEKARGEGDLNASVLCTLKRCSVQEWLPAHLLKWHNVVPRDGIYVLSKAMRN